MTDQEKAIVTAYTGYAMFTGDKLGIFYDYVEKIMGRPIFTHEIALLAKDIQEAAKRDFLKLCAKNNTDNVDEFTDAVIRARLMDLDDPTSAVLQLIDTYLKGDPDNG